MAGGERWYFTKEQLQNTPSRKCGMDADKELSYRQQATNIIQELGQRLQVTQLCINTGIVYMHRFYMFHSFTKFHRNAIAACALFLAAKVEEQPRKLEHVIRVAHMCLHREVPPLDVKSDAYQEQAHELVVNENIMLQTLGFDIAIEHPHTSVVKFCDLVRANKDLAQTSYFMATNSLHLTTMCLQYKPTVVACVCIHLAKKWSSWEIPKSNEGKDWFYYVDKTVTLQQIEELTSDFLAILDKCPSRLKQKQSSCNMNSGSISGISGIGSTPFPSIRDKKRPIPLKTDPKQKPTSTKPMPPSESGTQPSTSNHSSSQNSQSPNRKLKPTPTLVSNKTTSQGSASVTPSLPPQIQPPDKKVSYSLSAYNEKKEKERSVSSLLSSSREIAAPPVMREKERKPIEKVSSSLSRDIATRIPPNQQQVSSKLPPSTTDRLKQPDDKNKGRLKLQEQHNSDIVKSNTSMQPANPEQYFDSGVATQNFYDSLMNKPANFFASGENSNPGVPKINWDNPSTDGEDSSTDIKKEIASDLKMEFSDNDSNVSGSGSFSLASLPSLMPTEQGFQVKTEPSTQVKIEPSIQVKAEPKSKPPHTQSRNSFMSIFATEPSVNNSENRISNSHYNASLNSILEEKPAQLPPILSPLEPDPVTTTRKGKSPCVAAPQAEEIVSHDTPNIHIPNSHLSPTIMKIKQEPKATPTNSKAARGKSPEDSSYEIKKSTAEGLVTENVAKEALNLKEKHHHRGHHHHHHHHHKHEKHHKEKKHKHKNKDKDKDKHKSKERGSEKESQDSDSSKLKITLPVPKDRYVQDPDILNKSPIKLKISKKKLSDDFGGERVPEEPPKSLRIVIPKDRLSGNISSQESSSRKRKSSPRDASSSREKVARMDNDKHVSGNGSASVHVEKKDHSSDKKRMFSSSSLNCPIPQNQSAILNNYPPEHQQGVSTVHNVPAVNQNQRRYK